MARPVTVGAARRVAGLDFKTMIAPFRIPLISAGEYKLMALGPGLPPRAVTRQTPFLPITVIDSDVTGLVVRIPIQ
jgi:hypothetical protein